MTTQRQSLETVLWSLRLKVGVMPPLHGAQVSTFPIKLGNLEAEKLERRLDDIGGRMGEPSVRGGWLPGSSLYSLELPRQPRQTVKYGDMPAPKGKTLPLLMGVTTTGRVVYDDLTRMPHLLVAGQTGGGKSVAMNAMLATLISNLEPSQVRLVLSDVKAVELTPYTGIPHLLGDIITEPDALVPMLEALVEEMSRRYKLLAKARVRDFNAYNKKSTTVLPHIVVFVDELADTMLTAKRQLEPLLQRLLAKARAAGIHLVLGTQRVSAEVLTPTLKINVPARLAFACDTFHSSKAILDADGAQRLLGQGDALYKAPAGAVFRLQAPHVTPRDVDAAVMVAKQMQPHGFNLEGYQSVLTLDSDLSRLERARLFVQTLEKVASTDLTRTGIASSETVARDCLKALESEGLLSAYDPANKCRYVLTNPATASGVARGASLGSRASQTEVAASAVSAGLTGGG